ncbi:MAG: (d)CMP kinase [Candidatus Chromulinivorax sp.]
MNKIIITLDGPCGSGKSTIAQLLAQRLGFFYINSGYLYRSLAYILVKDFDYNQIQLQNPQIEDIVAILDEKIYRYSYQDNRTQIFYKNNCITDQLKSSAVSEHASLVSAHQNVREQVALIQKKLGELYHIVTDGRDCGTHIYPQAAFKFYVTADATIRASRLHADLIKKGKNIDLQEVILMTLARDERDINRLISPLKKADDALEIDTSNKSVEQIVDFLFDYIQMNKK